MGALKCATRSGSEIQLPHAAVDSFRSRVRGGVVGRGDDGYDRARVVFNAMIDRLPALIVQCAGAADVMEAVMFAREYDLGERTGRYVCTQCGTPVTFRERAEILRGRSEPGAPAAGADEG